MSTAQIQSRKPALDDACRRVLADWQPGRRKELRESYFTSSRRNRYATCVELGYLKVVKSGQKGQYCTTCFVERTAKPRPPRRYIRPAAGSLFPWNTPEHWEVILASPLHAQREMFQEMVPTSLGWKEYRARHREIDAIYPEVESRHQLASARKILTGLVATGDADADGHATYLVPMFASPERIARALVMLLLKPVVLNGRIERFAPLGPEEQMDELKKTDTDKGLHQRLVEWYQQATAAGLQPDTATPNIKESPP